MWLIASDLHLTDAPRDSYRNGIFDFIAEQAKELNVTDIFILGDITDRKDNHSGAFINSLVKMFYRLSEIDVRIHILQGNHDYSDPSNPTLGFLPLLANIDIRWFDGDCLVNVTKSKHDVVMFPFCRNEDDFKSTLNRVLEREYQAAFFHQTFAGANASTGMAMEGIPVDLVKRIDAKRYFSGDIHVPQKIGCVEYVGSPYQIRFGDDFKGRVIAYDPDLDIVKSLYYPTISKRTLSITSASELSDADIGEGDQIKLRLNLPRDKLDDWKTIEAEIMDVMRARGADLYGVEIAQDTASNPVPQSQSTAPEQVFDEFCTSNKIDGDLKEKGAEYL